jgi:diguanylate cyclase (GGDEF)-like protein
MTLAINVRDFPETDQRQKLGDDSEKLAGRRWTLRVAGAVLLTAGFVVVSFVGGPIITGVVFAFLGAYAYVAANFSRRSSVEEEKRLRMDLLVHNMELEKLASKDELTQLYNRSYFVERLERELKNAQGFNRPVSVLLIDIDGMKEINATHGQRVGDEVLKEFGKFLLAQTRASDLPARIDGDCFAVILPDTADDGADIMIERLTAALPGRPMFDDGSKTIEVTVSLGVAGYPWSSQTADSIVQEAEVATEAAKRAKSVTLRVDSEEPVPAIYRAGADNDAEANGSNDR